MEINLYKDIQSRTNGEIYIGIVGPVRTGKSTFIKRFMDVCVLPNMTDEHAKKRALDELPQSSGGRTITTTEPKFIPKEAAKIKLGDDMAVKVRLIDCVGFMIDGAAGHMEEDIERMVKTPWSEDEIPFTKAAEIGTQKVIRDHSTIGFMITADGSFGEFERENYLEAEQRTINELKEMDKPFIILLNTTHPYTDEVKELAINMEEKYQTTVMPVNCEQLKREDIEKILEKVLYEFPVTEMEFYMPKWVELLPTDHPLKMDIIKNVRDFIKNLTYMKDIGKNDFSENCGYVNGMEVSEIDMSDGTVKFFLDIKESYYYNMLSDLMETKVEDDYQLLEEIKELALMKKEYIKVKNALEAVKAKGYGVVTPGKEEILLQNPEMIKHGNKYGVKIKAESPSIHMIRANIETEIAPIVGTEEQAKDLIGYIGEAEKSDEGIWNTNIFGKTVEQLVQDGINSKISMIGDESQIKLQETMQKIVNDCNGGMVCIII